MGNCNVTNLPRGYAVGPPIKRERIGRGRAREEFEKRKGRERVNGMRVRKTEG
jgi:hypothetical protein